MCASRCPTHAITMKRFDFYRECVTVPAPNPKILYQVEVDDARRTGRGVRPRARRRACTACRCAARSCSPTASPLGARRRRLGVCCTLCLQRGPHRHVHRCSEPWPAQRAACIGSVGAPGGRARRGADLSPASLMVIGGRPAAARRAGPGERRGRARPFVRRAHGEA